MNRRELLQAAAAAPKPLAISQGSLRRGSAACYLDINHPEIEEFLEIETAEMQVRMIHCGLQPGVQARLGR